MFLSEIKYYKNTAKHNERDTKIAFGIIKLVILFLTPTFTMLVKFHKIKQCQMKCHFLEPFLEKLFTLPVNICFVAVLCRVVSCAPPAAGRVPFQEQAVRGRVAPDTGSGCLHRFPRSVGLEILREIGRLS